MNRIKAVALSVAMTFLLTACEGSAVVPEVTSETTESITIESTTSASEVTTQTTDKVTETTTEKSVEEASLTVENVPPTTESTVSPIEVTSATATATAAATTTAPKTVTVPKIYGVSSPGTVTLTADKAVVDISNASSGYISAKYLGTNKKVKIRISHAEKNMDYDLDCKGKVEYYPLQLGNGEYSVQILENIESNKYSAALSEKFSVSIPNTLDIYLRPSQFIWFTQESAAVKKAAELCDGKTGTIDKISAIYTYVTSNVKYDKALATNVGKGYVSSVDSTLVTNKGICFDYAALFAAMCRSQGIPTKLVVGYAAPTNVYHSWNEVYTQETGWIAVDVYLKNNGFNLVDTTFYASASDKNSIASYIGDGTNYIKTNEY